MLLKVQMCDDRECGVRAGKQHKNKQSTTHAKKKQKQMQKQTQKQKQKPKREPAQRVEGLVGTRVTIVSDVRAGMHDKTKTTKKTKACRHQPSE
jgi:hypothetical protein